MRNDFVALILTHGRANNVITYNRLRKAGYTGDIRLVVDDEDDQYDEYCRRYPGEVVQFHKAGVKCQTFDNRKERRVILFARNVAFDIARQLGYRYFIELDDDYNEFAHRFNENREFKQRQMKDADGVFEALVEFLQSVPFVASIAMAQKGDFIGGGKSNRVQKITLWRKAMNTFVCDVERPFYFSGRINEDVNTYTMEASRGMVFFTLNMVCINQEQTQHNKGGMTGAYLDGGTYIKSFYSVICMPSAVKVGCMGFKNYRLHHHINWNNCVPKILREELRRE